MDLTALELGLRNRQLLQVKCFLKIQVETFRYFLSEELPRLKNADERLSALDKFFTHDWQNVINKIVSVAVVNMTGDYVSMMLAVSLFRAVIQSCNQLLLIIASIEESKMDVLLIPISEEPGRFLSRSSSSTSSSHDSQTLSDSGTVKEKIFSILQRQIRSINSHLERIYSINFNNDQDSNVDLPLHYSTPRDDSNLKRLRKPQRRSVSSLSLSDVDNLIQEKNIQNIVDIVFHNFDSDLETTSNRLLAEQTNNILPLLQFLSKKYSSSHTVDAKQFHWNTVVHKLIELVSSELKSNELSPAQIERFTSLLSQTGISCLYLLFTVFVKTCDAKLRQKLLQVFFTLFDDLSHLETAIESVLKLHNTAECSNFNKLITDNHFSLAKYLKIMSLIDLYAFCYRPKLLEMEQLEISIEWILTSEQTSRFSFIKSIVLPSLEEICIHPDLFSNWQALNEHIYDRAWPHVSAHFVQKQDFASIVSTEVLWQYWVDNNKVDTIQSWIERETTSLPYCSNIVVPNDADTCRRMVRYLREEGAVHVFQQVMQSLCTHQTFFSGHSLLELDSNQFTLQKMLGYVGQVPQLLHLARNEPLELLGCFFDQDHISEQIYFHVISLIQYCLDNELYEFIYLICNKYHSQMEPIIVGALQNFESAKSILKFLFDLETLCNSSKQASTDDDAIYAMAMMVLRYLHNGNTTWEHDSVEQIARLLIEDRQDIELTLLVLSFSKKATFDQLAQCIQKSNNKSDSSNLSELFLKILNSKHTLLYKAFEPAFLASSSSSASVCVPSGEDLPNHDTVPSRQAKYATNSVINLPATSTTDLYSLLQQAISYVNVDKFFKWQIKRRFLRFRCNSTCDDSTHSETDDHTRTRKISSSLSYENHELPNFSQNRLSELYGLKAELTSSYYLKNARLLESFFKCTSLKSYSKNSKIRDHNVNPKLASKAIRKAALIAYGSIRQNSVFACCLLFQSLMRSCLSTKSESNHKKVIGMEESMASIHSASSDASAELEKTRLHLSIGKLIIEFAADSLSMQGALHQQSALSALLRKSHFNGDRCASQKLLDLAVVAIERKHTSASAIPNSPTRSFLNNRLHSLLLNGTTNQPNDDANRKLPFEDCALLMECFEWKPILMFADLHSLKRPFNFLTKCAREDNWLVFCIFAQMYTISKDDIQSLLRSNIFNNHCIGEHLAKAFQSSSRLTGALSQTDSKLVKLKRAPNSSRNDLYSRIFKDHAPRPMAPTLDPSIAPDPHESDLLSTSSSPETFSLSAMSMVSKMSDESGLVPLVLYVDMLAPDAASKDFLQLVLEIYQNCTSFAARTNLANFSLESTFRNTLLYASVSLSNPVLSLLACSLDRAPLTPVMDIKSPSDSRQYRGTEWADRLTTANSANSQFKFTSFMCWLLSSVDPKLKHLFLDSYLYSNGQSRKPDLTHCYLKWNQDRSLHLIDVLTQHNAAVFVIFIEGLNIFDLDIPILQKLLKFFIQFFIEKDYYQSDSLLLEFKSLLQAYNEDEFMLSKGVPPPDYENFETEEDDFMSNFGSLRIFYSKSWIEKCCLIMMTNSLLLAQQFELGVLLSHYNFVRLQESFSPNCLRIPDIRSLYFFSQCLAKLPHFVLPIAELLRHGPALCDNSISDYTEYVSIFRKLIFDLQEAGHFEEARNIINLLPKTNINEFIINEWMLKAKKMNNAAETSFASPNPEDVILDKIDLTFWENCWAQVTKLDPSMHSAFKVMERFVQHLQPNQVLIKCFVLLKCMLAIESILRDFIETNQSDAKSDDTTQNSLFDDLSNSNLELVQDYFQFEYSLWSSAVECEFLILHKKYRTDQTDTDMDNMERTSLSYGDEAHIANAWKLIWRDIIFYTKSSSFGNFIIPKLSLKHTFSYKNVTSKRNKLELSLDSAKKQALDHVIGRLLDSLCLQKAKEVSAMFNYTHDDFEIIQACDNAAKGQLHNVTDAPFRVQFKMQKTDSTSSTNSYALFIPQNIAPEQKKIISLIHEFSNYATIGRKSCNLILIYYKIACLLHIPYSDLMNSNFSALKLFQLLLSSCQSENVDIRNRTSSDLLEHSFENRSYSTSELEPTGEADTDTNRNAGDFSASQSCINQYMEAIACGKDLIKIVCDQDEELNSEIKIAAHLAQYTHTNVQQLVDQQFKDVPYSSNLSSVTEIELDKHQLALNSARFLVLIKLLHEPSILGHALIDICKKQKGNLDSQLERVSRPSAQSAVQSPSNEVSPEVDYILTKRKHYVLLVELYVRAHECFTAQCDVHGIALVLRRTRLLITQELHPSRFFHLILRLLTGIGRYSEMTYCFDLFGECDRFELILSKRVTRTPQLRIALLNYLKTSNKVEELLPLVAIRFFLHRETADYHRARAERILSDIFSSQTSSTSTLTQSHSYGKFNSPTSSSSGGKRVPSLSGDHSSHSPTTASVAPTNASLLSMRNQLETVMYEFQEAETNYTKASSHTNADYCSRKSQLIALQICYINRTLSPTEQATSHLSTAFSPQASVPLILSMDTNQVREFIYYCNHFYEALIVSKAYAEVNTDWTDPILHNAILNGNLAYLSDYAEAFPISSTLLKNLLKRYDQLSSAFKQQSRSVARDVYHLSQPLTNSPSSASFLSLLGTVRSENDLHKSRRLLEQLLERALCPPNESASSSSQTTLRNVEMINCSVKDKHKLIRQFDSPRLLQRLVEEDAENSAYILDLKRTKKL